MIGANMPHQWREHLSGGVWMPQFLLCWGGRTWANSSQVLYSPSGKTFYRQILRSLEALRLCVVMIVSLWNFTCISAAVLPKFLSNFKAIGKVKTWISWLLDFARSCSKRSVCLVNRGPAITFTQIFRNQDWVAIKSFLHFQAFCEEKSLVISRRFFCTESQ